MVELVHPQSLESGKNPLWPELAGIDKLVSLYPLENFMQQPLPQNLEQLNLPVGMEWTGAVNFLLLEQNVVLIKRSEQMPTHKGQIAFFGGHRHKEDQGPQQTAFREFEEESGLSAKNLKFLGLLPPMRTSSKHSIIPVLSRLTLSTSEFLQTVRSNGEWSDLYLLGINDLIDQQRWCFGNYHNWQGEITSIAFFPFVDVFSGKADLLWGATGKIVLGAVNIMDKF